MPADRSSLEHPDPLLAIEARLTVSARKKDATLPSALRRLMDLVHTALRPVPVVMTMLLLSAGYVTFERSGYPDHQAVSVEDRNEITASIRNTTISVISSTMLTSIPTLRN